MVMTNAASAHYAEDLVELARSLATKRQLVTVLEDVAAAAVRLTGAEACTILALDTAGRNLGCVCARNDIGMPLGDPERSIPVYHGGHHFNLSDPNVFAMVTGKIVNIGDIYAASSLDFTPHYLADSRNGSRTQSFVAVPLWSTEGATLGVLQLLNLRLAKDGSVGPLPEALERPLGSFSAFATVAITNARLFEENRQLIRRLNRRADELTAENDRLRGKLGPGSMYGIIGDSAALRTALDLAMRAARSRVAVLLLGETGTGKDVFARAIHSASERRSGPIVAQNCAALPETLLESELFGHRRGAFSGAVADKQGLVHEAAGGSLFLDEIGDMPLALQAKILRLLEDGIVRRVGDTRGKLVDVRLIAATNADIGQKITAGTFREDLYYRLGVFPILLPPLRERREDIPLLIDHFLALASRMHHRAIPSLSDRAFDALCAWRFPGNVRELKNLIDRALLLLDAGERIDLKHLPQDIVAARGTPTPTILTATLGDDLGLKASLRNYEAKIIAAHLQQAGWNQSRAASRLKISRRSLIDKMQQYDLRPEDGAVRRPAALDGGAEP